MPRLADDDGVSDGPVDDLTCSLKEAGIEGAVHSNARHFQLLTRPIGDSAQVSNSTHEQVILVPKMHVEGRSADVSSVHDVLYGNLVIRFLVQQTYESLMQQRSRPLNALVRISSAL
jgi:hypothetical protein